jgi:hypothetical protein
MTGQGLGASIGDWVKVYRLIEVTGKDLDAGRGDWTGFRGWYM